MKRYATLARPFTLLPPLLGIISGAVCAWGSAHNPDPSRTLTSSVILTVVLGSLCASFLNAANNSLNQIYDLEIDRINKPKRPLVTGEISIRRRWIFTWIMYALGLDADVAGGRLSVHRPGAEVLRAAAVRTSASSSTWSRSSRRSSTPSPRSAGRKRIRIGANLTIAIPRGCLLKVAGWTMVAHAIRYARAVVHRLGLHALPPRRRLDERFQRHRRRSRRRLPHAADRLRRAQRAAWMIAPFFVFPWLLIPLGARPSRDILTGNGTLLTILGIALAALGRVHGLAHRPQSRRADRDGEPSVMAAHVSDDDGRAGRVRGGLPGLSDRAETSVAPEMRATRHRIPQRGVGDDHAICWPWNSSTIALLIVDSW